jgi:hypothetical protein
MLRIPAGHRGTMPRLFVLVTCSALIAPMVALLGHTSATAATSSAKAATCKQVTKAEVQPLIAATITKLKVTVVHLPGGVTGQQCEYSGADGVIDVVVVKSTSAKQVFKEDVDGFSHKVVVAGVTGKAYRATDDFQMEGLDGQVDCSVSADSAATIPGVAALQDNGNSDGDFELSESDNTIIATALGTICNRVFGKGNTKPSLAGLM